VVQLVRRGGVCFNGQNLRLADGQQKMSPSFQGTSLHTQGVGRQLLSLVVAAQRRRAKCGQIFSGRKYVLTDRDLWAGLPESLIWGTKTGYQKEMGWGIGDWGREWRLESNWRCLCSSLCLDLMVPTPAAFEGQCPDGTGR
jgi:hypothetical protein